MSFDWISGQMKSTGFDWDSGNPGEIVLPTLPKPKVDVKEEYVPTLARYANEAFAKRAAEVAVNRAMIANPAARGEGE